MSFIRNHLHLTTENGGENQKQELSHKVIFFIPYHFILA